MLGLLMHGLINKAIQAFLIHTYGDPVWDEIRAAAKLPFHHFEALLHYDRALLDQVLLAAAARLDKPVPTLLEDVGTWLVSGGDHLPIRRLLRFGGDTFEDFLESVEEIPGRARLALADLDMPDLALSLDEDGHCRLQVDSDTFGFAPIVLGALRALADDYGALVLMNMAPSGDRGSVIEIELLEARFAKGRSFRLDHEAPR